MASDDEDTDESLMKQVLNMVLENNALMPYLAMWGVFNLIILIASRRDNLRDVMAVLVSKKDARIEVI